MTGVEGVHKELIELTAQRVAKETGREVASETLRGLGVDVDSPIDMQADFQHLRKNRTGAEDVRKIARRTGIGVLVTGGLYALWEGLSHAVGK